VLAVSVATLCFCRPASDDGVRDRPVAGCSRRPGALFAPDLVNGRTTVLDLRLGQVADRFEGVTMPHFAPAGDRYVVVADEVLLVSYPERAVLTRMDADIRYPWQVEMLSDTVLLALERGTDGAGPAVLHAVDLSPNISSGASWRVTRRSPCRRHQAVAFADASSGTIELVAPATLTPVGSVQIGGRVRDVAFLDLQGGLAAVAAAADGSGGELKFWKLKVADGGGKVKKERALALTGIPTRLAIAPGERQLALALEPGSVAVVDVEELATLAIHELAGPPRDLVWCDPDRPGPFLPDWSDDDPQELGSIRGAGPSLGWPVDGSSAFAPGTPHAGAGAAPGCSGAWRPGAALSSPGRWQVDAAPALSRGAPDGLTWGTGCHPRRRPGSGSRCTCGWRRASTRSPHTRG
jgi:hypothetical protein